MINRYSDIHQLYDRAHPVKPIFKDDPIGFGCMTGFVTFIGAGVGFGVVVVGGKFDLIGVSQY